MGKNWGLSVVLMFIQVRATPAAPKNLLSMGTFIRVNAPSSHLLHFTGFVLLFHSAQEPWSSEMNGEIPCANLISKCNWHLNYEACVQRLGSQSHPSSLCGGGPACPCDVCSLLQQRRSSGTTFWRATGQ